MLDQTTPPSAPDAARKAWMGLLARAPEARLAALLKDLPLPTFTWLRPPEIGGVMVRGRAGGTGAAFNLGEMTVTRCALRTQSGEVGHAYVQGRSKPHAERAAMVDALMQGDMAETVQRDILDPLQVEEVARRNTRAARAAATKVDFFTMVRGED